MHVTYSVRGAFYTERATPATQPARLNETVRESLKSCLRIVEVHTRPCRKKDGQQFEVEEPLAGTTP